VLKAGDMMIRDQEGIISSILYGPDQRTQIRAETHNAVFTVYAPPGIDNELVMRHLRDIQEMVLLFSPRAQTIMLQVFGGR
jgi:DNA/RNA-binding domain of Phe-tRNA-synthetase-like protein